MTSAPETGPADQHLGESLAALIDGELSHDSRDRVLAHLATCPSCKDEADAQRRLKSVFAQSPLPTLSAGLLARLQGLPATDGTEPPARGPDEEPPGPEFGPLPGGRGRESLLGPPIIGGERGFRIHEPGAAARLHRGHRLAFAAAGAVSLAAFAIGGAMSSATTAGAGTGSNGSTLSTVAAGGGAAPVSAARPTSARGSEDEESRNSGVSLPIALVSYTGGYPGGLNPSDTSGSTGLAERLFPALGPILAPGPVSESSTSASTPMLTGLTPAGGSGGVGTVNAR